MGRNVVSRMSDDAVVALCLDGEAWPRALMSATLIPDNWMGLVERPDGRRRFVPAGEDPRPERNDKLVLVRNRPVTVPLSVASTPAADAHCVSATGALLVRWQARDDDLAALRRSLLAAEELSIAQLAEQVANAGGTSGLRKFIRQRPAAKLVHEDVRDELLAALREELKRFLFSSGLTLAGIATLKLASPSLSRQETLQRETAARVASIKSRALVEQTALAATKRRLRDLGDVLTRLQDAAARHEDMQWRDLLPSLAPAERGRLLENLWRVTPNRKTAATIVVVAGRECVWIAPDEPERLVRRSTLPEELGGLRSVTFDAQRNWLLVGAARGIWALDAHNADIRGKYMVPDAGAPRTGFNAAAIARERLWGTHSQLGAWCWPLAAPEEAGARLAPAGGLPKTIRAATATADGRVLFAADERVHIVAADAADTVISRPAPGTIQCLAVEGETAYAGTANGDLLSLDLAAPDGWTVLHWTATPFESIHPRRWSDLLELVIPTGGTGVCGVFPQEGIVTRLMETPVAVRRAWACDDLLVALSDYRDRLIVMNTEAPERTGREVPISRMLGHSVQDVCLVLRGENTPTSAVQGT